MNIEKLRDKAFGFKEQFFFGELGEIICCDESEKGIFLLGKNVESQYELFWAVNEIEDLKVGIKKMRYQVDSLIFRVGKKYHDLLKLINYIKTWDFPLKEIHIGFRLDFNEFQSKDVNINDFPLQLSEIDEIIKLERKIFDWFNASYDEYEEWIKSKKDMVLTLKDKDKMIGFIIVEDVKTEQCFIRNLGIDKNYQGNKLGGKLLQKAMNIAKNNGCKKCFLWVGASNEVAIHLYEKCGFTQDENEAEAVFVCKND